MDEKLRQWVVQGDEVAIQRAYLDDACPQFFAVDWRAEDEEVIEGCFASLGIEGLGCRRDDEEFYVSRGDRELRVPLEADGGDLHRTICTLNELLAPDYELRMLVCSHGSDTLGLAALAADDWKRLEREAPQHTAANFLAIAKLPNIFTELTDDHLPPPARACFDRMLARS